MKSNRIISGMCLPLLFSLVAVSVSCSSADGQPFSGSPSDLSFEPILRRDMDVMSYRLSDPPCPFRSGHIHLFNMPSALPGDPLGIMPDYGPPPSDSYAALDSPIDSIDDRFQLSFGADNPFFDLRRHGDPGGVGYYRMYSQVGLLDSSRCSLGLVVQGVTPAGLEADGIASGPTILSPSLACSYEFVPGTGIHAFVGKDVEAHSHWTGETRRDIRYGMALQTPCPGTADSSLSSVHLFVETIGRYRVDDSADRPLPKLDVLPGLHWQFTDNWWMTGGLLMPLGSQRWDGHLWQVTCAWRY
jgi:hypothetical protein